MAKVIGDPGRNAAQESFKKFRRTLLIALAPFFLAGMIAGRLIPQHAFSPLISSIFLIGLFVATFLLIRRADKWMAQHDKEFRAWRKGAVGEALVADILSDLSDEYMVFNDITKRFGNIDHVVVGPTGIFVIDTKNWRGAVSAGSDGEMILNGTETDKKEVHNLEVAVMDFHAKLKALCEKDFFVRGVMAFASSHVDARFGSTKHIHCLTENRLIEYIQNEKYANRLSQQDRNRIERATRKLAEMDERFDPKRS